MRFSTLAGGGCPSGLIKKYGLIFGFCKRSKAFRRPKREAEARMLAAVAAADARTAARLTEEEEEAKRKRQRAADKLAEEEKRREMLAAKSGHAVMNDFEASLARKTELKEAAKMGSPGPAPPTMPDMTGLGPKEIKAKLIAEGWTQDPYFVDQWRPPGSAAKRSDSPA